MSISPLEVAALPSGDAELVAALAGVDAAIGRLLTVDTGRVADSGLVDGVRRIQSLEAQLASVRLGLVAAVDQRQAARRTTGATSTAAWLKSEGMAAGQASRDVALAQALTHNDATREALASGQITTQQAEVIATALDGLSDQVDQEVKAAAEQRLLAQAPGTDPWTLRREATAQAARIDPTADQRMAAAEQSAKARRELWISQDRDGMHLLRGRLDTEGAAMLQAALDPLTAPRPSSVEGHDRRSPQRRRADALLDLAHRALTAKDGLPVTGGVRPTVIVTIDHTVLTGQVDGCAQISGGTLSEPLSAEAARRWACDAQILPAVLGSAGEILDLGRSDRSASVPQRRALAIRDRGCAFPGCDRPPGWTDAHHIRHWSAHGPTDLDNLVLLCGAHHDSVHHHDWTITLGPDRQPVFTPPQPPPPEPPW